VERGATTSELLESVNVTLKFLEENVGMLTMLECVNNPAIPENFLERHLDTISLEKLYYRPKLSLNFLEKNVSSSELLNMFVNYTENLEFIDKHKNDSRLNWKNVVSNSNVPLDYLLKNFEKTLPCLKEDYFWKFRSDLTEEFVEKYSYLNRKSWDYISCLPFSEDFVERHIEDISWVYTKHNPNLTVKFWDKHTKKAFIFNYHFSIFPWKKYFEKILF